MANATAATVNPLWANREESSSAATTKICQPAEDGLGFPLGPDRRPQIGSAVVADADDIDRSVITLCLTLAEGVEWVGENKTTTIATTTSSRGGARGARATGVSRGPADLGEGDNGGHGQCGTTGGAGVARGAAGLAVGGNRSSSSFEAQEVSPSNKERESEDNGDNKGGQGESKDEDEEKESQDTADEKESGSKDEEGDEGKESQDMEDEKESRSKDEEGDEEKESQDMEDEKESGSKDEDEGKESHDMEDEKESRSNEEVQSPSERILIEGYLNELHAIVSTYGRGQMLMSSLFAQSILMPKPASVGVKKNEFNEFLRAHGESHFVFNFKKNKHNLIKAIPRKADNSENGNASTWSSKVSRATIIEGYLNKLHALVKENGGIMSFEKAITLTGGMHKKGRGKGRTWFETHGKSHFKLYNLANRELQLEAIDRDYLYREIGEYMSKVHALVIEWGGTLPVRAVQKIEAPAAYAGNGKWRIMFDIYGEPYFNVPLSGYGLADCKLVARRERLEQQSVRTKTVAAESSCVGDGVEATLLSRTQVSGVPDLGAAPSANPEFGTSSQTQAVPAPTVIDSVSSPSSGLPSKQQRISMEQYLNEVHEVATRIAGFGWMAVWHLCRQSGSRLLPTPIGYENDLHQNEKMFKELLQTHGQSHFYFSTGKDGEGKKGKSIKPIPGATIPVAVMEEYMSKVHALFGENGGAMQLGEVMEQIPRPTAFGMNNMEIIREVFEIYGKMRFKVHIDGPTNCTLEGITPEDGEIYSKGNDSTTSNTVAAPAYVPIATAMKEYMNDVHALVRLNGGTMELGDREVKRQIPRPTAIYIPLGKGKLKRYKQMFEIYGKSHFKLRNNYNGVSVCTLEAICRENTEPDELQSTLSGYSRTLSTPPSVAGVNERSCEDDANNYRAAKRLKVEERAAAMITEREKENEPSVSDIYRCENNATSSGVPIEQSGTGRGSDDDMDISSDDDDEYQKPRAQGTIPERNVQEDADSTTKKLLEVVAADDTAAECIMDGLDVPDSKLLSTRKPPQQQQGGGPEFQNTASSIHFSIQQQPEWLRDLLLMLPESNLQSQIVPKAPPHLVIQALTTLRQSKLPSKRIMMGVFEREDDWIVERRSLKESCDNAKHQLEESKIQHAAEKDDWDFERRSMKMDWELRHEALKKEYECKLWKHQRQVKEIKFQLATEQDKWEVERKSMQKSFDADKHDCEVNQILLKKSCDEVKQQLKEIMAQNAAEKDDWEVERRSMKRSCEALQQENRLKLHKIKSQHAAQLADWAAEKRSMKKALAKLQEQRQSQIHVLHAERADFKAAALKAANEERIRVREVKRRWKKEALAKLQEQQESHIRMLHAERAGFKATLKATNEETVRVQVEQKNQLIALQAQLNEDPESLKKALNEAINKVMEGGDSHQRVDIAATQSSQDTSAQSGHNEKEAMNRNSEGQVVRNGEEENVINLLDEEDENEGDADEDRVVKGESKSDNSDGVGDEDIDVIGYTGNNILDNHQRKSGNSYGVEDEEIEVIGYTGNNALADFVHPREVCVQKPFAIDPKIFCSQCYCFVCEVKASECTMWLDGNHCQAQRSVQKWFNLRGKVRRKRNAHERIARQLSWYEETDVSGGRARVTRSSREFN